MWKRKIYATDRGNLILQSFPLLQGPVFGGNHDNEEACVHRFMNNYISKYSKADWFPHFLK